MAAKYREVIPVYIKDYVNLERCAAWASTPLSLTIRGKARAPLSLTVKRKASTPFSRWGHDGKTLQ